MSLFIHRALNIFPLTFLINRHSDHSAVKISLKEQVRAEGRTLNGEVNGERRGLKGG